MHAAKMLVHRRNEVVDIRTDAALLLSNSDSIGRQRPKPACNDPSQGNLTVAWGIESFLFPPPQVNRLSHGIGQNAVIPVQLPQVMR